MRPQQNPQGRGPLSFAPLWEVLAAILGSGWGQASLVLVSGVPGLGRSSQPHLTFPAVSLLRGSWKLVKSARLKKASTWAKPCWRMVLSTMVSGGWAQVGRGVT